MPLMYDQFDNARTLQRISPDCAVVDLQRRAYNDELLADELEPILRDLCSPLARLRAGCFGKRLRDDPREQGMNNCIPLVLDMVYGKR
jgi:hypothetical protein